MADVWTDHAGGGLTRVVRVAGVEELKALGKRLKAEEDGKALRRDLIRHMKVPLKPAVAEIKAGVMGMRSRGNPADGQSLRKAVARRITAEVKLSGKRAGVRVRGRKTPAVRGFQNAPQRINRAKGWRHLVFGREPWVGQVGKPGFFDDPLSGRKEEFRRAVRQAMEDTAARIAGRAGKGPS